MAKVLALSFGRKMSNTDVMLKEVLKKCEEAGHEIKFMRPDDLEIQTMYRLLRMCRRNQSGRTNGACVFKDDFHLVEDAYYDADAVIIGSPVISRHLQVVPSRHSATVSVHPTIWHS